MKYKINAIILASGFSKRMGCNKLTLPYKGKLIIENLVDEIVKIKFNEVILLYRDETVKKALEHKPIYLVQNHNAERGMSNSIKLGVSNSSECDGYMFFVGDQINLKEELILKLIQSFEKDINKIVVPLYNGERGNPVIFPVEFKEKLLELSGDKGGRIIIEEFKHRVCYVNITDERLGIDIDTEAEYIKNCVEKGDLS
jgi:molybdenum cofactor cytidylyltransferase